MAFNYFYGKQADQYGFVRIPKLLMTEKMFEDVSTDAKLLYGLLIDRMGMAQKNDWIDEENRVYVLYPIAEIQEDMGVSKKKAIACLSDLEKSGLVEKRSEVWDFRTCFISRILQVHLVKLWLEYML